MSPTSDDSPPSERGALVRDGRLVRLRRHVPENRAAFQRWYADEEIVHLLRHDQAVLNADQSRSYFDSIILPLSARGLAYAIHEAETDALIGTTALTDLTPTASAKWAMFRIVIGDKTRWGRGYGTEATRLVVREAFLRHGVTQVRLEVFGHNERALAAYARVGFRRVGQHTEWVGRTATELHVVEMRLDRDAFWAIEHDRTASEPEPEPNHDAVPPEGLAEIATTPSDDPVRA